MPATAAPVLAVPNGARRRRRILGRRPVPAGFLESRAARRVDAQHAAGARQASGADAQGRFCSYACAHIARRRRRQCARCGESVSSKYARYCSVTCRSASFQRTAITRSCTVCGTNILVPPSRAAEGRGQFCSKQCHARSRAVPGRPPTVTCEQCGEVFSTVGRRVDVPPRYCSQRCYGLAQARHTWRSRGTLSDLPEVHLGRTSRRGTRPRQVLLSCLLPPIARGSDISLRGVWCGKTDQPVAAPTLLLACLLEPRPRSAPCTTSTAHGAKSANR
jgi:hypothetical protein